MVALVLLLYCYRWMKKLGVIRRIRLGHPGMPRGLQPTTPFPIDALCRSQGIHGTSSSENQPPSSDSMEVCVKTQFTLFFGLRHFSMFVT